MVQSARPGLATRAQAVSRRRLLLIAGALALADVVVVAVRRIPIVSNSWPLDFDLNWIAARRLLHGQALYDGVASRVDGVQLIGTAMGTTGTNQYRSFIGSPFVALQHAPFALLGHDSSVDLFRLVSLAALVAGVWCASRALPEGSRRVAMIVGLVALAVMYPVVQSLALGQGNGFVVLALGCAVWAIATGRWTAAGIALGVAAALKLPLVILVLYLVARGCRRVIVPAIATFAAGLVVAATVGRPSDLVTWIGDVLPSASQGSSYIGNQSAIAWVARMAGSENHLDRQLPLGPMSRLGVIALVVGLVALARTCRHRHFLPQELGVVVLLVLVATPLSWDHYFAWVVVAVVLACHPALWDGLGRRALLLAAGAVMVAVWLLAQRIHEPTASAVARDWSLRLRSGPYAVAALTLMVVFWTLTSRADRRADHEVVQ